MKFGMIFVLLVSFFALIGCEKKEDKPAPPIVVQPVDPQPEPPKDAEKCELASKHFSCGPAAWWNYDCGDKEKTVYFASIEEIVAAHGAQQIGACIRVTYKDGSEEMLPVVGAGPCLPCQEI